MFTRSFFKREAYVLAYLHYGLFLISLIAFAVIWLLGYLGYIELGEN